MKLQISNFFLKSHDYNLKAKILGITTSANIYQLLFPTWCSLLIEQANKGSDAVLLPFIAFRRRISTAQVGDKCLCVP